MAPVGELRIGPDIVNVNRPSLEGGARHGAAPPGLDGMALGECPVLRGDIVRGDESKYPTIEAEDHGAFGRTQPHRVLGERLEDRLEIERRPPDHLEQFAGRGLLLERGPQLAVPRPELLEQANVLDGDHGLIAEGLQELDMAGGELPRSDRWMTMTPIGVPSPRIIGTPSRLRQLSLDRHVLGVLRVGQEVWNLRDGSVQDCPPRHLRTGRRHRVRGPQRRERLGGLIVMRHQMEKVAIELIQGAGAGAGQLHRAANDGHEHGLDVRRRAADDAQDLAGRGLLLERLGQVRVLGLKLGEQPRILDRDDRLVGEGLQQGDLALRKQPHLLAINLDRPEHLPSPQQRDDSPVRTGSMSLPP